MDVIDALLGWGTAALVIVVPVVLGAIGVALYSTRPLEKKYVTGGGGVAGGFASGLDAAFSPTAHEASIERERQIARTAPAPAPGDRPWDIEGERIRIDM